MSRRIAPRSDPPRGNNQTPLGSEGFPVASKACKLAYTVIPGGSAIAVHLDEQKEEILSLRRSHTAMARLVQGIEEEMQAYRKQICSENISISTQLQAYEENSMSRTILFARIRATKVLQTVSKELGRKVLGLSAANSIVQVILRSGAADCTLKDFQALAVRLLADESIPCRAVPSEYNLRFPNLRATKSLSLVFQSFCDLFKALKIDVPTREAAMYRERCNSARQLRAVQILGSETVQSSSRSILLGLSGPLRPSSGQICTLYQESTFLFEETWESEFSFRMQPISALYATRGRSTEEKSATPVFCGSSSSSTAYSLHWKRLDDDGGGIMSSGDVPGALTSLFPAIVLRTNVLTRKTRELFNARFGDIAPAAISTDQEEGAMHLKTVLATRSVHQ